MPLLRAVEFPETDRPLREDVGRLGALVGELLIEQEGQAFFERVEAVREAAIRRREREEPVEALVRALAGLSEREAERLARAFSTYFQVVNIAERIHRIRRRREYERQEGAAPQPGGLNAVLRELKSMGVKLDELATRLGRFDGRIFIRGRSGALQASRQRGKDVKVVRYIGSRGGPERGHQTLDDRPAFARD